MRPSRKWHCLPENIPGNFECIFWVWNETWVHTVCPGWVDEDEPFSEWVCKSLLRFLAVMNANFWSLKEFDANALAFISVHHKYTNQCCSGIYGYVRMCRAVRNSCVDALGVTLWLSDETDIFRLWRKETKYLWRLVRNAAKFYISILSCSTSELYKTIE